jgi:hypothetical protein
VVVRVPSDLDLRLLRIAGTANMYRQGGSYRLSVPTKAARTLSRGTSGPEDVLFLIETDKGILIVTLQKLLSNEKLSYFAKYGASSAP